MKLPEYMDEMFVRNCDVHKRTTRHNELYCVFPRYNLETETGRSFTVSSIKEWNSLPVEIRKLTSVKVFI